MYLFSCILPFGAQWIALRQLTNKSIKKTNVKMLLRERQHHAWLRALLHSSLLTWQQNTAKDGAKWVFLGRAFHRRGPTTKKSVTLVPTRHRPKEALLGRLWYTGWASIKGISRSKTVQACIGQGQQFEWSLENYGEPAHFPWIGVIMYSCSTLCWLPSASMLQFSELTVVSSLAFPRPPPCTTAHCNNWACM